MKRFNFVGRNRALVNSTVRISVDEMTDNLRGWVLLLGLACAGCAPIRPAPAPPPTPAAAPIPQPELPQPTATHRFDIDADTQVVGYVQKTVIGKDDTLSDIARRFDVGYDEMVLANPGVDPWLPGAGREVVVPTQFILPPAPHQGVIVNLAAMRLFFYPPHKRGEQAIVYTYPIGIGREGWKTREGTTRVTDRTKDPVWIVPASVRAEHAKDGDPLPAEVRPGPDNPLGQYRLRLGWPTYLIHGTNKPYGVGMRVSHGCMHLYPEDIAALFDMIPVGTKVTIVNQPYLFGWQGDTLYMQAYGVMEDDRRGWSKNLDGLIARRLDAKTRDEIRGHDEWPVIDGMAQSPRAVPVPIGSADGLDAVVSRAVLVGDVLPDGSNWNGGTELSIDEKTFEKIVGAEIR
jgi:L,D-transpeptidase ErfK/SrfK